MGGKVDVKCPTKVNDGAVTGVPRHSQPEAAGARVFSPSLKEHTQKERVIRAKR